MNIKVFNRNKKSILLILFLFFLKFAYTQQVNVTGQIVDKDNNLIQGVSVYIQGQTKGIVSDINGKYSIKANVDDEINFSFMGMKSQRYTVKSSETGNLIINVMLSEGEDILEEVVIVGYGTENKQNLATTQHSVEAEAIENRGVSNVSESLQGLAPSLVITPTQGGGGGGAPGNGMVLRIRGFASISGGGSPLILVDGIERNINTLDPNDIESVTVLEDISSAAIYGARASFGVILISTKSGGMGKPTVSYSLNTSFQTFRNIPNKPGSVKFGEAWNDAFKNSGSASKLDVDSLKKYQHKKTASPSWDFNNSGTIGRWDESFSNVDAFKESFKDIAMRTRHNLSVSGSFKVGENDRNVSYNLRGSMYNQEGMIKTAEREKYDAKSIGLNLSIKTNSWLNTKIISDYTVRETTEPIWSQASWSVDKGYGMIWHLMANAWPNMGVSWDDGRDIDYAYNYLNNLSYGSYYNAYFYTTASFIIEPIEKWKTYINYRYSTRSRDEQESIKSVYHYNIKSKQLVLRNSAVAGNYIKRLRVDNYYSPQIYSEYQLNLDDHYLKATAGFEQEDNRWDRLIIDAKGGISDDVTSVGTSTGDQKSYEAKEHWATRSFFGALNYTFGKRYILNTTIRQDGSSRFIKGKRWGTFYSYALGYNMHNEPALKDFFEDSNINIFKLKFSSGQVGNQNIGLYQYLETLTIRNNVSWIKGGKKDLYTSSASIINEDITWEKIQDINYGISMSLLDNKLGVDFTYFNRTTKDMLGPVAPLPSTLGASAPKANNAELETQGFSFSLVWKDKIGKDFNYEIKFNLSDAKSKITKFYNPKKLLSDWFEGQVIGDIWGYETVGIMDSVTASKVELNSKDAATKGTPAYPNQREIGTRWSEGDIKYKDLNGDGKITPGEKTLDDPGDKKVLGNTRPRYTFSLDNIFNYKGIGLRIYLQGIGKKDANLSGSAMGFSSQWDALFVQHLDYWRKDNKTAFYPKPYFNTGKNRQTQSKYIGDASYIRVKNLTLSYNLEREDINLIGLKTAKIYFSVDNIVTFTNIPGYLDPELITGYSRPGTVYPLYRTYSLGFNISF